MPTGVAKALLAAGASVAAKDVAGFTAVHHCLTAQASPDTLAICRLLLFDYGADADARNRFDERPALQGWDQSEGQACKGPKRCANMRQLWHVCIAGRCSRL